MCMLRISTYHQMHVITLRHVRPLFQGVPENKLAVRKQGVTWGPNVMLDDDSLRVIKLQIIVPDSPGT